MDLITTALLLTFAPLSASASVIGRMAGLPRTAVEARVSGEDFGRTGSRGDEAPFLVVRRRIRGVISAVVPLTAVCASKLASVGQGIGSGGRIRTTDQGLMSPLLYH